MATIPGDAEKLEPTREISLKQPFTCNFSVFPRTPRCCSGLLCFGCQRLLRPLFCPSLSSDEEEEEERSGRGGRVRTVSPKRDRGTIPFLCFSPFRSEFLLLQPCPEWIRQILRRANPSPECPAIRSRHYFLSNVLTKKKKIIGR
jgi:hypothetical protein